MYKFDTILLRFDRKGEKTGWTYIDIPADIVQELNPNVKTSFRVKGKLDNFPIKLVALLPMGDGSFIMPINANMRKGIKKSEGATISVLLEVDTDPMLLSSDLLACLEDEPAALAFFYQLSKSHQNYFSKWIESAKMADTKANRIEKVVKGLSMKMNYGEMYRYFKENSQT
ncbi:MAG: DUF1905 domain-containing protein [Cytophagales bacterium]|nr:MAG: DUF1905 domain-containing protein [Cytophagales bacterium]